MSNQTSSSKPTRLLACVLPALLLGISSSAMALQVQILGSGSPSNPERAETSILLKNGNSNVLIDMGNGAQSGLDKAGLRAQQLSALMITHHHIDHDQEFPPILVKTLLGNKSPQVIGPAGTQALADFTTSFYKEDIVYRRSNGGKGADFPKPDVKEVRGGESFKLLGMDVKTAAVNHSIETVAYRFEADGKSVVFSGDLYYSESLVTLAKDADLLIIDAGAVSSVGKNTNASAAKTASAPAADKKRAHATPDEIVRMVEESGAKTVVLTHFVPGKLEEAAVRALFAARTKSKIIFATDMLEVKDF